MSRLILSAAAVVLLLPQIAGAQQTARVISLDEAVRMAQQNAPSAIQARGNLRNRNLGVRSAYAAFLPTLSTGAGMSRPSNPANPNVAWRYSNQISTSITLFDPTRYYAVSEAKRQLEVAEASEISNRFSISLQVKQQFFNSLNARENEAAARSQLAIAEQQYQNSVARVREGTAIASDSLRARITVGNARIAVATAENSLRQAQVALTRLTGAPYEVQADPADTLGFAIAPIDSAMLFAIVDESPAVQQSRAQLALARSSVKTARSSYWPRINSFSFSRSGSGTGFYGYDENPFAYSNSGYNFGVSMTLWDNFRRENSLVSSNIGVENAEASLRDQRMAQHQALSQWLGTLRVAELQLEVLTQSVLAAEEDVRIMQARYELDAATLLEVTTSQDALIRARSQLISARHTYRTARAQIESIIGREL
jgi:outer membrane protein TolC